MLGCDFPLLNRKRVSSSSCFQPGLIMESWLLTSRRYYRLFTASQGAAVGIRHHPGAGRQRPRDDGLAPLEASLEPGRHGYPYQQREQADLQRRERRGQPCIHTDEHRQARRDEGTASEVRPGHMPWQPARHQRDGIFEIEEMGDAEGDQSQTVKRPRDAQTLVAGGETEAQSVPVIGEPTYSTQALPPSPRFCRLPTNNPQ